MGQIRASGGKVAQTRPPVKAFRASCRRERQRGEGAATGICVCAVLASELLTRCREFEGTWKMGEPNLARQSS